MYQLVEITADCGRGGKGWRLMIPWEEQVKRRVWRKEEKGGRKRASRRKGTTKEAQSGTDTKVRVGKLER